MNCANKKVYDNKESNPKVRPFGRLSFPRDKMLKPFCFAHLSQQSKQALPVKHFKYMSIGSHFYLWSPFYRNRMNFDKLQVSVFQVV